MCIIGPPGFARESGREVEEEEEEEEEDEEDTGA